MHMRIVTRNSAWKAVVGSLVAPLLLSALSVPAGAATPECGGRPATIVGTSGPDQIVGTPGDDVIATGKGRDTIRGRGGADRICSGDGQDEISGGGGNDRVWAGGGADLIGGGNGNDRLVGGAGGDRINGNNGFDRVDGGAGIDGCRTSEVLANCEADLSVDVQGPALITNNETESWTFAHANRGPSQARRAKLTITFASRLTVQTVPSGCVEDPQNRVVCQLGNRDASSSGQVVITAEAPAGCSEPQNDTFEVSATIGAPGPDHVPGDDSDSLATTYVDGGC